MRVLIVIKGTETGGVLTWLKSFTEALKKKDVDLFFAASERGESYHALHTLGNFEKLPFTIDSFSAKSYLGIPLYSLKTILRNAKRTRANTKVLSNYISSKDVDFVIVNGYLSIPKLKKKTRPKIVSVIHTVPSTDKTPFKIKSRFISLFLKRADYVVAVGKPIKDNLGSFFKKEIKIINNGSHDFLSNESRKFSLKEKHNIPINSQCMGTIGRFVDHKGFSEIIDIFEILAPSHSQLHCVLAGSPVAAKDFLYEEKVKVKVSKSKHKDRIHLLGYVENTSFFPILDVFLLVNINIIESFGLVLIEAMSAKVPVIAPNAGGPKDIVEHKINGFIVDPNSLKEYAEACKYILDNPNEIVKIVERARENYLTKYSLKVWGDEWFNYLNSLKTNNE